MTDIIKRESRVSALDEYIFMSGVHPAIHHKLGAHLMRVCGTEGVYFAVWAPNAREVDVVGDFNGWEPHAAPMKRLGEETGGSGIWELFVPEATVGDAYRFRITASDGRWLYKADPYAGQAQLRPDNASIICEGAAYQWSDARWMRERREGSAAARPMSVYELHIGSWRRNADGSFYTYTKLAEELSVYVKEMGYTHVELMGIAEHPLDASWGYQVTGYFAPTARYGTPRQFKELVNTLHQNGIGVIIDWVPAHFAKDEFGLAAFDGSPLYEYGNPMQGENRQWGTKIFDYGKKQVQSFLISNALYWLEDCHVDGLRVDAVSAMLYLDYGKQPGEWLPNAEGGNINTDAVCFLQRLNRTVKAAVPDALMIAEESSAWKQVTGRPDKGGLGFDFKWNMGWMNDFLEYMETDSYFRKYCHNKMTFSLTYADAERFVLPLSHDEVVHLKKPLLYRMFGASDSQRFAALRAAYAFMFGHPGKKLLFMGDEFGARREWSEAEGLDWELCRRPEHEQLRCFTRDILLLYRDFPVLWKQDDNCEYGCFDGFEWLECNDGERSIFSFVRKWSPKAFASGAVQGENLLFLIHFTPVDRYDYRMAVPQGGSYSLVFDEGGYYAPQASAAAAAAIKFAGRRCTHEAQRDAQGWYLPVALPSYGVKVWSYTAKNPQERLGNQNDY